MYRDLARHLAVRSFPETLSSIDSVRYKTRIPRATLVPNAAIAPNWTTTCTNPLMTSTCSGPALFPVGTAVSATSGPQCTDASQCSFLAVDPNLKNPKSLQWNVDLQRALTSTMTLDVAYVGTHGYDEIGSVDVNQPPNGTGWDLAPGSVRGCSGHLRNGRLTAMTGYQPYLQDELRRGYCSDRGCEAVRRGSSLIMEYIAKTVNEFHSNYDGLQITSEFPALPWPELPRPIP